MKIADLDHSGGVPAEFVGSDSAGNVREVGHSVEKASIGDVWVLERMQRSGAGPWAGTFKRSESSRRAAREISGVVSGGQIERADG